LTIAETLETLPKAYLPVESVAKQRPLLANPLPLEFMHATGLQSYKLSRPDRASALVILTYVLG
jgi:hypothetical protein